MDVSQVLSSWLESYSLTDVWQHKNPGVREYLCHSETHKKLSRIDMLLSTMEGLPLIINIGHLSRALSDHLLVEVNLDLNAGHGKKQWRMNVQWLQDELITIKLKTAIANYWKENGVDTHIPNLWEAFKSTLRGVFNREVGSGFGCRESRT